MSETAIELKGRRIMGLKDRATLSRETLITEYVVHVLNIAVVPTVGHKVVRCRMCGGTEQLHQSSCPVPVLEDWLWNRQE